MNVAVKKPVHKTLLFSNLLGKKSVRFFVIILAVVCGFIFVSDNLYHVHSINVQSLEKRKSLVFFGFAISSEADSSLKEKFEPYTHVEDENGEYIDYSKRRIIELITEKKFYYKKGLIVHEIDMLHQFGESNFSSEQEYKDQFFNLYKSLREKRK